MYIRQIKKKRDDKLQILRNGISLIFDINFEYSIKVLVKEDYINKILNRFNFKENEITYKQIEEVKKIVEKYIEERISKR